MFQHKIISIFQNLSLGFILKIFLKFRKFRPRYSYKMCSYKKKSVYREPRKITFVVCDSNFRLQDTVLAISDLRQRVVAGDQSERSPV